MGTFTRVLIAVVLACSLILPIIATRGSWGIGSEENPKVAAMSKPNAPCPSHLKDSFGNCKSQHRSIYGRRSYYGGGPRAGK